jgi:hypothetical protein
MAPVNLETAPVSREELERSSTPAAQDRSIASQKHQQEQHHTNGQHRENE